MNSWLVARAAVGLAMVMAVPGVALAQMATEIIGQPVQVTTNGITNTVYLDPGGSARIMTPGGNAVPGTWTAANGQLCLSTGAAHECFPYNAPFQAGTPLTLASSCGQSSTWLASATNAPPAPPPPVAGQRGERGK